MLLLKCTGDDIWDVETCHREGVPETWIRQLLDCHESGFDQEINKIYFEGQLVNQFHGVHDLKLACKLADYLGMDWKSIAAYTPSRSGLVRALIAELDEL